jgi:hypothetical protein
LRYFSRPASAFGLTFALTEMTDRKKPGLAFWATLVVVGVLAYPLSFGPACWITSHSGYGSEFVSTVYQPLLRASFDAPAPIATTVWWCANLFAAKGWTLGQYKSDRHCDWGPSP